MIYSPIAIGFSLIFGVGKVMNLATWSILYITCYLVFTLTANFGLGLLWGWPLPLILTVGIAVVSYLVLIKPMKGELIQVLIITLALAMFLEQFIMINFGTEPRYVPSIIEGSVQLIGAHITYQQLLAIIIAKCYSFYSFGYY